MNAEIHKERYRALCRTFKHFELEMFKAINITLFLGLWALWWWILDFYLWFYLWKEQVPSCLSDETLNKAPLR